MAIEYISTTFENSSPLDWQIDAEGTVHIGLHYDRERASSNRAAGHWHFQVQGEAGTRAKLVLRNFDNIWNGKPGSPISARTSCFYSVDGKGWSALGAEKTADNRLEIEVQLGPEPLYLARLEPYRLSDLAQMLNRIAGHPLVEVEEVGKTVEGRPLEMVHLGNPTAPYRILLRARSHPWEPGGNWVVQGLVEALLEDGAENKKYLEKYQISILPMAAKDGVVRGHTRFNGNGVDLNRGWDRPADRYLAPENWALEAWLETMAARGQLPHLAIDFHNDNSGKLHLSRPPEAVDYWSRMERLEGLLRQYTWFREGATGAGFRNPSTFGEGLFARWGIDACILELNCDWIEGLGKVPFGQDWMHFGAQLRPVFFAYCS